MYLNSEIVQIPYNRLSKDGKNEKIIRNRTKSYLKCDHCETTFSRLETKLACTKYTKHYCGNCPIEVLYNRPKTKTRKDGYIETFVGNNYPYRKNVTWMREHIAIMEIHIGKKIPNGMVVHHIDGNKHNNSIDNLLLCTTKEHNLCHARTEQIIFQLYMLGLVGFDKDKMEYYYKPGKAN